MICVQVSCKKGQGKLWWALSYEAVDGTTYDKDAQAENSSESYFPAGDQSYIYPSWTCPAKERTYCFNAS